MIFTLGRSRLLYRNDRAGHEKHAEDNQENAAPASGVNRFIQHPLAEEGGADIVSVGVK
jgi:hypothetical protein